MKKLKQLLMTILVFVLTFAGLPAASADTTTYTIQLTGTTAGHTYDVYQIFSGSLDASNTLTNIEWGSAVNQANIEFYMGTASAKAASLSGKANDSEEAKTFAKDIIQYLTYGPTKVVSSEDGTTTISGLEPGYYLIRDRYNSLAGKEGESYTRFMLLVSKDTNVAIKSSSPTITKKVKASDSNTYSSAADYAIGDKVYFELTATLPSNYADYSSYQLVIDDIMPPGLTYNYDAQVILKNGNIETDVTSKFNTYIYQAGEGIRLNIVNYYLDRLSDVTITASSKFIIRYSTTLGDKAITGVAGNENTVSLTYLNEPNEKNSNSTAKTPDSKAKVYTYQLKVNKVKENQDPLAGAGFTLYKKVNNQYTEIKKFEAGSETTFDFKGLDSGDYKLVESTVPAGYNAMKDIEFTISGTIDSTGALTNLTATSANATFETDVNTGIITLKVVNKQGALLPNTGGIGTTILYLVGTSLVFGAGVLFVVKKRVSTK